jgi:hypothetical protein
VCRNLCGGRHSESACYFQMRTLPNLELQRCRAPRLVACPAVRRASGRSLEPAALADSATKADQPRRHEGHKGWNKIHSLAPFHFVGLVSLWFTKIGATGESFLDQKRVHGVELHPGDGLNTPQKSNHFQLGFNSLSLGKGRAKRGSPRRGTENGVKRDGQKTRDYSALLQTQFQGGWIDAKIKHQKMLEFVERNLLFRTFAN